MNIAALGPNYSDLGLSTVIDGLLDLGHKVYDVSGKGLNYMEPFTQQSPKIDFYIMADTDNLHGMREQSDVPKVIAHLHDRWTDYINVPDSPIKYPNMAEAVFDIMFYRDYDGSLGHDNIYPMEFGIERRFNEACQNMVPFNEREFDISFYGTRATAQRWMILDDLVKMFKCDFADQLKFKEPDDYWSKWVNGRYVHAPKYYQAMMNSKMVFCGLGAGASCGRTYEAYAAGCVPLIQKYPAEIIQLVSFVDGQNCILWSNGEELKQKMKEWLSSPYHLEELASRCYKFGQENLLSRHRAQFMLDKMMEREII